MPGPTMTPVLVACLAMALPLAGCAATAGGSGQMGMQASNPTATAGDRFIVKFREGSAPAGDPSELQRRLDALAPEGVMLAWKRRLAVGADLFIASRPLDPAEAEALMRRFRGDPDVEYIEPDARMGIGPVRPGFPGSGTD